jgi:hypothetical protein
MQKELNFSNTFFLTYNYLQTFCDVIHDFRGDITKSIYYRPKKSSCSDSSWISDYTNSVLNHSSRDVLYLMLMGVCSHALFTPNVTQRFENRIRLFRTIKTEERNVLNRFTNPNPCLSHCETRDNIMVSMEILRKVFFRMTNATPAKNPTGSDIFLLYSTSSVKFSLPAVSHVPSCITCFCTMCRGRLRKLHFTWASLQLNIR